ncbi:hypothetical protein ACLKA6_005979 [Drosophila palustris]
MDSYKRFCRALLGNKSRKQHGKKEAAATQPTSSQVLPHSGSFSACSQRCCRAVKRKDDNESDEDEDDLAAGKQSDSLLFLCSC